MSQEQNHGDAHGDEPRVVVRDRRRIDPQTGQVRPPAPEETPAQGDDPSAGRHAVPDEVVPEEAGPAALDAELKRELDERTADLQRLQAEYANYRKRVERDREVASVNAKATLAGELLSVLDDVERAAAHGDLTGAFKAVAEKLAVTLQHSGLESFAHEGEPFDPSVHEAVQHDTSPDVDGPTVTAVLRRGYRFGERLVRPALVAVTEHEGPPGSAESVPTPPAQPPADESPVDEPS